jgi:hypothetical protein
VRCSLAIVSGYLEGSTMRKAVVALLFFVFVLVALVAVGTRFPDGKTRILPDLPSDSIVNLQVDAALEPAIHNI